MGMALRGLITPIFRKNGQDIVENNPNRSFERRGVLMRTKVAHGFGQERTNLHVGKDIFVNQRLQQ